VIDIFRKWDLDAAVIGKVTAAGKIVVREGDRVAAELPIEPLTEGAPRYDRPVARPAWLEALQSFDPLSVPAPKDLGDARLKFLARPTIGSTESVYE